MAARKSLGAKKKPPKRARTRRSRPVRGAQEAQFSDVSSLKDFFGASRAVRGAMAGTPPAKPLRSPSTRKSRRDKRLQDASDPTQLSKRIDGPLDQRQLQSFGSGLRRNMKRQLPLFKRT